MKTSNEGSSGQWVPMESGEENDDQGLDDD